MDKLGQTLPLNKKPFKITTKHTYQILWTLDWSCQYICCFRVPTMNSSMMRVRQINEIKWPSYLPHFTIFLLHSCEMMGLGVCVFIGLRSGRPTPILDYYNACVLGFVWRIKMDANSAYLYVLFEHQIYIHLRLIIVKCPADKSIQ